MAEVVADEMKQAGMNVDIEWGDWARRPAPANRGAPDKGGWNCLPPRQRPTMQSPLTNIGTNMACDGRNFPGWPCDEEAERLRQAYLERMTLLVRRR